MLAPGDPRAPLQIVDVRDLGTWLVPLAESGTRGVFDATGPEEPYELGAVLERVSSAVGGNGRLVWTDEEPILAAGVQPWTELPLWLPADAHGLMQVDVHRAVAAGLTFRPLEETARDTLAWSQAAGEQRPTLSRERERELLRATR